MQKAYIRAVYELMLQDRRVVSLLSDSGTDYDMMIASELPAQCFNFGISEQNKLGIAAGMAMCGKIPFAYTSGAFLAYRGYEFIRNDICYQKQNVKIVGMGSGTSWRTLGPSHHTTEDLAVLRVLPRLTILSAATPIEAAACVKAAYEHIGPVYIRLGMSNEPEFFNDDHRVIIGGSDRLSVGRDIAIFSTGSILAEVMEAREKLEAKALSASVYNICSVKPIDSEAILEAAKTHRLLVSVEEHSIYGGLGGAISEVLSDSGCGLPLLRIGLQDCFAKGYGTQADIRRKNGIDANSITEQIEKFLRDE